MTDSGESIGLLSDAGTPCVADPGADIVSMAHEKGIQVIPLVGPSSILLSLMASGFNGQNFAFLGYLPRDRNQREKTIKNLESKIFKEHQTQIFIEAPYRNNQMMESLIKTCSHQTKICVARDITLDEEFIITKTVADWKREKAYRSFIKEILFSFFTNNSVKLPNNTYIFHLVPFFLI